jgi:hypothetical protein
VCPSFEKGEAALPADRYWYAPPPAPAAQPRRSQRGRFILLGVVLTAVLLGWVYSRYVAARQTSMYLVGATYPDDREFPPNPYMWNGMNGLGELSRDTGDGKPYNLRLVQDQLQVNTLADWDKNLNRAGGGTVLIFLGFHGCADRHGPFFLPPQVGPLPTHQADSDCLRFEAVLERLRQLPRSRNIVLLLDATQIHRSLVHHDFVWALDKLNDAIADMPNLIVINASDVGQRSWLAQDFKCSIFAHYVIEALRGSADREPRDGEVTALELVDYVAHQVRQWAKIHHDAEQTPALWPRGHVGRERAGRIVLSRQCRPQG